LIPAASSGRKVRGCHSFVVGGIDNRLRLFHILSREMKKEFKPKMMWRKSLIFSRRPAAVLETGRLPKVGNVAESAVQNLLSELSAFERSWFFRSPLSSQFVDEIKQSRPRLKVKVHASVSTERKKRSLLPEIPVRRSTLIDIIKSKRIAGGILEQVALKPPIPA
jgi:hypothetical protein